MNPTRIFTLLSFTLLACASITAEANSALTQDLTLECKGQLTDHAVTPVETGEYQGIWVLKHQHGRYRWYRYNPDTKGWNRDGLVDATGKSEIDEVALLLSNQTHYMGADIHMRLAVNTLSLNITRVTAANVKTAYPENTAIAAQCEMINWPIESS